MKPRTAITITASAALLASVLFGISQQTDQSAAPVADTPSAIGEHIVDPLLPRWVNPETGEELTPKRELVEDTEINSDAKKAQRVFSLWAIQNPQEHANIVPAVSPPKTDPDAPEFDIAHPELYVEAMQAKETAEERTARELSELAISDPSSYVAELKFRGIYSEPPPSEDTQSNPE
ncbi:MAG: hypothetical protein L0Z50_04230 [Verrucomicrobiales bacterium]|nr:hypothetical protein [Verrucomicrobiales bacterium]